MCRIIGYKTKDPSKTNDILIKSLKDFRLLSVNGCVPCGLEKGHNDGWGIVAYKNNTPCLYYRKNTSIYKDSNFDFILRIIENIKPDIVISHLRKISTGLIDIKNTQPFLSESLSLAHNGTIFLNNIKNSEKSDSLLFFNNLIFTNKLNKDFESEYKKVQNLYDYTAMNMIFSDGINLFTIKNVNSKNKFYRKMCFKNYYTLYNFNNGICNFFCSEKINSLKKFKNKNLINKKIYKV